MEKWARVMYQPNLPLGEGGVKLTGSKAHIELSKNAAKEGMVLLKNEGGLLPLKKGTRVALFGKAAFDRSLIHITEPTRLLSLAFAV